jgi:hypothetical protein
MARVRSPNYPALSLPEAISSVDKVFARENRHLTPKEVVVKAMGYGGVNGASLGSLSALLKYGLLDRLGENYRVADRAMAILHPATPQEKAQAVTRAAQEPGLFAEMLKDFPGSIPSDDNLRSYLVRRGFSPTALPGVIKAFRETMDLVARETGAYDSGAVDEPETDMNASANLARSSEPLPQPKTPAPVEAPGADPYRVSFTPSGGLEGSFRLNNADDLDALVQALSGLKFFFKKASEIRKPEGASAPVDMTDEDLLGPM